MTTITKPKPGSVARLESHIDRSAGPDSCHEWTGARHPSGYGQATVNGTRVYVHRWIASQVLGRELTAGEVVLHKCDNPPCANPLHLVVGSQAMNMRDSVDKGRSRNVIADANRAKTHCKRGHEFTPENTRITTGGRRNCRVCLRLLNDKYAAKRYPNHKAVSEC